MTEQVNNLDLIDLDNDFMWKPATSPNIFKGLEEAVAADWGIADVNGPIKAPAVTKAGQRRLRTETRTFKQQIADHNLSETPVIKAAENGAIQIFEHSGEIENYRNNPKGWPALHYALLQKDFSTAREILHSDPNQIHQFAPLNQQTGELQASIGSMPYYHGPSALSVAIENEAYDLIQEMVQMGADINAAHMVFLNQSEAGILYGKTFNINAALQTPLGLAIEKKNPQLLDLFLSFNPNTNFVKQEICIVATFRYLFDRWNPGRGCWEYDRSFSNIGAMSLAGLDDAVIRTLLLFESDHAFIPQAVIDAYKKYSQIKTCPPLYQTIQANDVDSFLLMLEYGADSQVDYNGKKGSDFAIESNNPLFFQVWLKRIDRNSLTQQSVKDLYQAAFQSGKLEIVELLLQETLEVPQLFQLTAEQRRIDFLELILRYITPAKDEIMAAIEEHLRNPNPDSKLLEFLFNLKK